MLAALPCWLPTLLLMLTHPKLVSFDTTKLLERKSSCLLAWLLAVLSTCGTKGPLHACLCCIPCLDLVFS